MSYLLDQIILAASVFRRKEPVLGKFEAAIITCEEDGSRHMRDKSQQEALWLVLESVYPDVFKAFQNIIGVNRQHDLPTYVTGGLSPSAVMVLEGKAGWLYRSSVNFQVSLPKTTSKSGRAEAVCLCISEDGFRARGLHDDWDKTEVLSLKGPHLAADAIIALAKKNGLIAEAVEEVCPLTGAARMGFVPGDNMSDARHALAASKTRVPQVPPPAGAS